MQKSPLRRIDQCLVLLTNRNIIVFKLTDLELFNKNMEFDKCLRRKLTIDISQIETIEIGLGQNYLVIEKNSSLATRIASYRLVTLDVYQSQTFLSMLLSE